MRVATHFGPVLLGLLACTGEPPADASPWAHVVTEMRQLAPCADPGARTTEKFTSNNGSPLQGKAVYRAHGAGAVVADFTGNDMLDVLVLSDRTLEYYVADQPGDLRRMSTGWHDLQLDVDLGFGAAAADYDGDGDLDVYISRYGSPNVLFDNDGAGRFVDVAELLGVDGGDRHRSASATWSDFDNDGDLDLIVAGHGLAPEDGTPVEDYGPGDPSLLFRNDGTSGFTDVSDLIPQRIHQAYSFIPTFVDLDGDGWRDLFVANDFGAKHTPALLAWNRQGTFVLDDAAANLDQRLSAMGVGLGDVNEDGVWDLLLPAWGKMALMQSSSAGVWVDQANALGLLPDRTDNQVVAWGCELADMDNDQDLDAMVVFGFIDTETGRNQPDQPDGLWLAQPEGPMVEVADEWGIATRGSARGVVTADLNDDGYLDLVVPDLGGPSRLHLSRCGTEGFLKVALQMPGANPDAVGATVVAELPDGQVQRRAILSGGTSYGSSGPAQAHFGLGSHAHVAALRVLWPDGALSEVRNVPSGHAITVQRLH